MFHCDNCSIVFLYLLLCLAYSSAFGDFWPLDPDTESIILSNYEQLFNDIETDVDLISELTSRNCFTVAQLRSIENAGDLQERNKKLLSFIIRGSKSRLKMFTECLKVTQPHLVPLLTENKGILC